MSTQLVLTGKLATKMLSKTEKATNLTYTLIALSFHQLLGEFLKGLKQHLMLFSFSAKLKLTDIIYDVPFNS